MGDNISDAEKEALKKAVYDEFVAFINVNKVELRRRSHTIKSAEKVRVPSTY